MYPVYLGFFRTFSTEEADQAPMALAGLFGTGGG
jgi:hypothetical protein